MPTKTVRQRVNIWAMSTTENALTAHVVIDDVW